MARSCNVCQAAWRHFRDSTGSLAESDAGTSLTRERWLLPLFQERGYGRLQTSRAIEIDEKSYPVSHAWNDSVPIHMVSFRHAVERQLGRLTSNGPSSNYAVRLEFPSCMSRVRRE